MNNYWVTYSNADLNCERDNEEEFEETAICKKYGFGFNKDYDHHVFDAEEITEHAIYELVSDLKEYLKDIRMYKSSEPDYEIDIIGTGLIGQDETFQIYHINEKMRNEIERIMGQNFKNM